MRIAKRFTPAPHTVLTVSRPLHPDLSGHRDRADKIYLHLLATDEQLAPEVASYARTSLWYHQPAASLQMMMLLELN